MLLYGVRGLLTKLILLCTLLLLILVSMTTFQWRTPTNDVQGYRDNYRPLDGRSFASETGYSIDRGIVINQKDQAIKVVSNNCTYDILNKGNSASKRMSKQEKSEIREERVNGELHQSFPLREPQRNAPDVHSDVTKRDVNVSNVEVGGGLRKMFQYVYGTTAATTKEHNKAHYRVTNNTTGSPRLLCWILTDPTDLERRTKHVKATWASRCDITLYMSSAQNNSFPTVGLNVQSGRNHIASKAKAAWRYIHKNYLNKADFFLKADPDTYIIVENLKEYLSQQDKGKALYFGHRFHKPEWGYTYMSGGAGLVLTREALRRLVEEAFLKKPDCMPDGQGEDWKTAKCLTQAGATSVDTRDSAGRERFLVFNPSAHVRGRYPEWYTKRDPDGALMGPECCSNYPISFHYIKPDEMYVLDYFLYRARPHGKELVSL